MDIITHTPSLSKHLDSNDVREQETFLRNNCQQIGISINLSMIAFVSPSKVNDKGNLEFFQARVNHNDLKISSVYEIINHALGNPLQRKITVSSNLDHDRMKAVAHIGGIKTASDKVRTAILLL